MAPDVVRTSLPDLRSVPLGDLPSLPSVTLEQAVRRVLPGRAVETITPAFSSSI